MDLDWFAADLAGFVGIGIDLSSLCFLQPPTRSAVPTKTDGFAIWSRGGLSIRLVWSVYLSLHGTQMRICPVWVESLLSPSRNQVQKVRMGLCPNGPGKELVSLTTVFKISSYAGGRA